MVKVHDYWLGIAGEAVRPHVRVLPDYQDESTIVVECFTIVLTKSPPKISKVDENGHERGTTPGHSQEPPENSLISGLWKYYNSALSIAASSKWLRHSPEEKKRWRSSESAEIIHHAKLASPPFSLRSFFLSMY